MLWKRKEGYMHVIAGQRLCPVVEVEALTDKHQRRRGRGSSEINSPSSPAQAPKGKEKMVWLGDSLTIHPNIHIIWQNR